MIRLAEEQVPQKVTKDKRNKYNRMILIRIFVLTVLLGFCMFIPLFWKLYTISIVEHDKLEEMAIDQQTKSYPIGANRGTIYDRNMNPLAISADVQTVCIAPNKIKDDAQAEKIAGGLSSLLGVSKESVLEKAAKKNRANEIVQKNVEKELAKEVLTYINDNNFSQQIFLEPATKRYYPGGSLAAAIIGFVGTDNSGLMGLEARYDEYLTGIPGYTISARDNMQNPLPNQYEMYYDAKDGYDITLSLDETIQHFVEKHLETAVIENEVAERACAIVMDVKTGGVLAMATMGDFDLNEPFEITDEELLAELEPMKGTDAYAQALSEAQQAQWRNKAINDTYEPGSTFKVFTAAMALEEKAVDPDTYSVTCTGQVNIAGWHQPISCHKKTGHGTQTFAEALQHSCNPAFIDIGSRVGPEKFYEYMEAFGFMSKTGIDLQGESRSLILSYDSYSSSASSQAVYSFGQTFKVTPIQMITAMSAIANGGYLMEPYVVDSVRDDAGNVVESAEPTVVRQVISEETSAAMREYLRLCVEQGTGSNAYVKGYNVAGKTGTSQKRDVEGADENGWYVVSFLGFAPADDPQIAVLVMLDQPGLTRNIRTGGYMAAPVAGRIIADTLPYMGVMKQLSMDDMQNMEIKVPFVKNKTVAEATQEADKAGLKVRIEGEGNTVIDQLPLAGSEVPATAELILYTEGNRPDDLIEVPNVLGNTPEEANQAMTDAGFVMMPVGAQETPGGILEVAWQEYTAGEVVPYGQVIKVEFRNQNVADSAVTGNEA